MGNRNKYLQLLFVITALEGLTALILTAIIPGERNSNLPGGLSLSRFFVLLFLGFASLGLLCLSLPHQKIGKLQSKILISIEAFAVVQTVLSVFLLFFLFFPPSILTTVYQSQFHRLYFLFAWITVANLQIMIFRWSWVIYENGAGYFWGIIQNTFKPWLTRAICILFPFLYFTPRLWVFNNHLISIGNDFVPFSYYYKVYLLDFLVHFRLPLWSPSEAAGFPYLASPQTGTLYPLNILFALLYWWKGSYGLLDHIWVTVFGISIFCLGLFFWLKEFRWKESSALIATLLVSVSYQLTEIIRFTKAVDSIAWLPWMLFFFTRILKNPSKKQSTGFYLWFSFAIFSFITAGYLYYQYYSVFLLVPLTILFLINPVRRSFRFPHYKFAFSDFFRPVTAILAPIILLIPNFMQMFILLQQVHRRGAKDYFYATEHTFSWVDHLGSLVYPPIASPEGWYYFGIIPLALVFFYFLTARTMRSSESSQGVEKEWYLSPVVKTITALTLFWIIIISFGKQSFIFNFLWNYFPFFYGFRYWGRFTILLIPVVGFVIAASMEVIRTRIKLAREENTTLINFKVLLKWFLILGTITALSIFAHSKPVGGQWDYSFYMVDSRKWVYSAALIASILTIALTLIIFYRKIYSKRVLTVLGSAFFLISILDLWSIGAFQWAINIIPEVNPPRDLNIARKVLPMSFNFPRTIGKTNISITPSFSIGTSPDWYFERYYAFYTEYASEVKERDILLGRDKNAQKLFLSKEINHETIASFLTDSVSFSGSVEILKYDGETLEVTVESPQNGYLSFIDNWDPFWTVTVNGKTSELNRLFGTFKSVEIPAGHSIVRFDYKPPLFPIAQLLQVTSGFPEK